MNEHVPVPRARRENFAALLAERDRRQSRADQCKRGWYDKDGVRQGGLIAFVRAFWRILEPSTPLVDGWPMWAICEHLEAVTAGEVTRLLINVPPGFCKSLLVDVYWPAWEWGPMGKPHYRYVAFSYSASLTERDNDRFRSIIASPEYQSLYGPLKTKVEEGEPRELGVGLRNKTTLKVMNTRTGWKLASSVGGVGTGERGDRIIIDDPHNVVDSESEVIRTETVRWFRESVSSRFNDLDTGALVVIMQRVHADDVSGAIADLRLDYCHLCIPMEFDCNYQTDGDGGYVQRSTIDWVDPRYVEPDPDLPFDRALTEAIDDSDGVLAWPERFSPNAVARLKSEAGPYAYAGQYQQQPSPRGGGLFKRTWWQDWDSPDGKFPALDYVIASLDGAFTEKESNSPSALTIWGVFEHPELKQRRIILIHAWRKFLEFSGARVARLRDEVVEAHTPPRIAQMRDAAYRRRTMGGWGLIEWVADTCIRFKVDTLLIEAKASGMSAASELRNRYGLQQWAIIERPVVGDKFARALAVQPTFSQLMVYAPTRDWAEMVIEEMEVFPKGKYADLTDSTTQAMKYLRDNGLARTDEEVHASQIENVRHRSKLKPLYPV